MEGIVPNETVIGQYTMLKQIGTGSFASVWLAENVMTQVRVAIKVILKSSLKTAEETTRFNREISLLKRTDHPFIARFFELIENSTSFFLVMEYADNGNMLEFVNAKVQLPEVQARHYFSQLISVFEYLHANRHVVHRDMKAENVLLDKFNNIRVIDFGLSNSFVGTDNEEFKTTCGSPAYASPEMIRGQPYTRAVDIWSLGILLYSMVVGTLPFDDSNDQRVLQKIIYTDVKYPRYLSAPLIDLIRKMLAKDPGDRIDIRRIKEHPWFSQSEYAALCDQNFNEMFPENVVDKEIVVVMTMKGVDCRPLNGQLLSEEWTDLTATYKQLLRQKTAERMKEIMANLQNGIAPRLGAPVRCASASQGMSKGAVPANDRGRVSFVQKTERPVCRLPGGPPLPSPPPGRPTAAPVPISAPGEGPAPVNMFRVPTQPLPGRRLSRPMAIRRALIMSQNIPKASDVQ